MFRAGAFLPSSVSKGTDFRAFPVPCGAVVCSQVGNWTAWTLMLWDAPKDTRLSLSAHLLRGSLLRSFPCQNDLTDVLRTPACSLDIDICSDLVSGKKGPWPSFRAPVGQC